MLLKKKLTSEEQIQYMKRKGILFSIVDKTTAQHYLEQNNNYFKLQSYRENYDKDPSGKYVHLEFAYLQELAILDMQLRHILLKMCLDVEHYIKVALIHAIENDPDENGYTIVSEFILSSDDPGKMKRSILFREKNLYCQGLIKAYKWHFPIWAFVEIITFGDLLRLYNFYYKDYLKQKTAPFSDNLERVRQLRNAVAHNNCIMNNLRAGSTDIFTEIATFAYNAGCSPNQVSRRLSNARISQIVNMFFVFDNIVTSTGVKKARYKELSVFFKERFCRNSDFFPKDSIITAFRVFIDKIVDKLLNS